MAAAAEQKLTFEFSYDPSVAEFAVPKRAYLDARPDASFGYIATSALVVFDDDTVDNNNDKPLRRRRRVLLLQRASGDEDDPDKWEPPGGACDDEDESILHGAARELQEEAGLEAAHISGTVGDPYFYTLSDGKKICQFQFAVHVKGDGGYGGDGGTSALLPAVKLDPVEHQRFVWATEDEVKARKVGEVDLDFTRDEVEQTVFFAFKQSTH